MGKEWQWSRGSRKEEKEVVPGCMSGMMHFFDFHQLLFSTSTCTRPPQEEAAAVAAAVAGSSPQNQHNYSADELKGLEAPRNSLELDEVAAAKASASATGDSYFGIPLAPAPSPVKKKRQELHLLVEEVPAHGLRDFSVTPRTPNVVARLMGLEILPDDEFFTPTAGSLSASLQHSPKITTKSKKKKVNKKTNSDHESRGESTPPPPPARQPLQTRDCNVPSHAAAAAQAAGSSRSLPETPRASSERYRDADPRLSLQLNKENSNRSVKEYIYSSEAPGGRSLPPTPSLHTTTNARRRDCSKVHDENKSPRSRYYDAREIVKQMKESISRRGGSAANGGSSDEHLPKSRRTRTSTAEKIALGNKESKNSAAKLSPSRSPPPPPLLWRPSCSPELDIPRPQLIPKPSPSTSISSYAATRDFPEAKGNKVGSSKCQRASYERFTERIMMASPALSTSPPSNMVAAAAAAARRRKLEASQDHRQSPPEPPVHQPLSLQLNGSMKSAVFSNEICSFHHQWPRKLSKEQDPEFHYVRSILERSGRIMDTSQHRARWLFSPSLPIDPFVFHQLELELPIFPPGPVGHRCNRKLLFHLVDEILGELLGWSVDHQQHRRPPHELDKELLLERLWSQIRGFPSANCQVIGDIDALVAGDLTETRVKRLLQHPSVVAEAEDIVFEIEQDVLESLLGEAAASFTYWELTPTE